MRNFIQSLESRRLFSTFTFALPDVPANVPDALQLPAFPTGNAVESYNCTIVHSSTATGIDGSIGVAIDTKATISGPGIGSFSEFATAVTLTPDHPADQQSVPSTLTNLSSGEALSGQKLSFSSVAQSQVSYSGYVESLSNRDMIVNRSVTITVQDAPVQVLKVLHGHSAKLASLAADVLA